MSKVLDELRSTFGLAAFPVKDIDLGKHKWTMRPLPADDMEFAARLMDTTSAYSGDRGIAISAAIVATALVAIDGAPTHEVFNIDIGDEKVTDVNLPPKGVRRRTATVVFDFIRTELVHHVVMNLYDRYSKAVDGEVGRALSSGNLMRYVCTDDDMHVFFLPPKPENAEPYFCRDCGAKLAGTEEKSIPLA